MPISLLEKWSGRQGPEKNRRHSIAKRRSGDGASKREHNPTGVQPYNTTDLGVLHVQVNHRLFRCMGTQDNLLVSVLLPLARERRGHNPDHVCSLFPRMTEKKGGSGLPVEQ